MWLFVYTHSNKTLKSITSTFYLTLIAFLLTFNHNITMKKLVNIINFITIRLFNMTIFSQFTKKILDKDHNWIKITTSYCGYYKNHNINDWRFNENQYRKNIKFIKLHFSKFL